MPIQYENHDIPIPLGVVIYSDPLYRVDSRDTLPYSTAPFKFFTTTREEAIRGYDRRGQFLMVWQPTAPLILLNMGHYDTRMILYHMGDQTLKASLTHSFPVIEGRVGRVSDEERTEDDYNVIRAICDMFGQYGINGFYISATDTLHSEVAICQAAVGKLERAGRNTIAPPNNTRKTRRRPRMDVFTGQKEVDSFSFGPLSFDTSNAKANINAPTNNFASNNVEMYFPVAKRLKSARKRRSSRTSRRASRR